MAKCMLNNGKEKITPNGGGLVESKWKETKDINSVHLLYTAAKYD